MAYRNPTPTVDIIIELIDRPARPIILIESHPHPNRNPFGVTTNIHPQPSLNFP
jgi:hypothetical protein